MAGAVFGVMFDAVFGVAAGSAAALSFFLNLSNNPILFS